MGFLAPSDTIQDYVKHRPETVVVLRFAISENWSPPEPRNKKEKHLNRFNLAILQPSIVLTLLNKRITRGVCDTF
ncbi:MAG: hypothetical protein AAF126_16845, partial [Chloroflexota bacterium]